MSRRKLYSDKSLSKIGINTTYKSESFVKLQRRWYAKLKQTGFIDLEFLKENGDTTSSLLRGGLHSFKMYYTPETEYYYRKARFFLHTHKFANALEKRIWEKHSEGYSGNRVHKDLKVGLSKTLRIIRQLRKIMLESKEFEAIEAAYVAQNVAKWENNVWTHNRQKARRARSAKAGHIADYPSISGPGDDDSGFGTGET